MAGQKREPEALVGEQAAEHTRIEAGAENRGGHAGAAAGVVSQQVVDLFELVAKPVQCAKPEEPSQGLGEGIRHPVAGDERGHGYREGIGYGMIGWVIPLADYPDTYNKQPLAYAGLAAQKNYNSLYLNCVYASPERTERLKARFAREGKKLDMGKSCIRFRRADELPLEAIRQEIASTSPRELIRIYEEARSGGSC